jgi:predicted RNase H-like nuclease (RuvC/YqgF family)
MGMATVEPGKCEECGDNHWINEPCNKRDREIARLNKLLATRDAEIEELLRKHNEYANARQETMDRVLEKNKRLRKVIDNISRES